MIKLKTEKEIKKIAYGGKLLAKILNQILKTAKVGVTTEELDRLAEELIYRCGGVPAFKHYRQTNDDPPFPSTICVSINDEIVHTPASSRKLAAGDILTVDIGMQYEGLFTDMAKTIPIGRVSPLAKKLMHVTEHSLTLAIKQIKPGNYLSDISAAVQNYVEANGFAVVKNLFGHGVGHAVHEDPHIPNFIAEGQPRIKLEPGMVLAIEPMVCAGTDKIKTLDDGWTIVTADGQLSAHFEHTVAVMPKGHWILTQ